ncbi:trehalose-phosphatase [Ramlibacter sp. H39-3-26]|uniref:trehalose-phosphatase n=1 Tax=Curvibacter soli TaxID=3031331 RepID=UPI0023DB1436|nr:trehalose-phosphatase [Ramlibacter sp. H39-3-26]MDF1486452.1 trehalose-phosphatase [Ramlibacter sp. H39-3-26]
MIAPAALPLLDARYALFLDFDGTLVDIAPRPDAVRVPPGLAGALGALQAALGGALAIATGRPLADIDRFLAPLVLPAAGEHGALLRFADGRTENLAQPPDLGPALAAAQALVQAHPALLLERKQAGVALHYRHAPELEALCRAALLQAVQAMPGMALLEGKCVLEVKLRGIDKGRALQALMSTPPFAGRVPVFAGDDVTDESAIVAAQALGGAGIKVGAGASAAGWRCNDPQAVRAWLLGTARAWAPAASIPTGAPHA